MKEITNLVEKSEKFLKTAQTALDMEDYDSSVSRSYYAMFFMAEAVLLTKNFTASSHKGVISLFGEHFVKTGIFNKDMGKALNDAYDERIIGDYGVGINISGQEAADLLTTAENFVRQIKDYLDMLGLDI